MREYHKNYDKRPVKLTLTPSEYKDFEVVAIREDIGVATVIKNMALAYHQSNTLLSSDVEAQLSELNRLVRNIANNVNQVSHRANMGASVDINEVLAYLKQLDAVVREHTKNKIGGNS